MFWDTGGKTVRHKHMDGCTLKPLDRCANAVKPVKMPSRLLVLLPLATAD